MFRHPNYSNLLFFKIFENEPRLFHFSTTRTGGVSRGEFRSLNLGNYSDDNPLNIYENRSIVARKFYKTADDLITPHQTHSNKVLLIDTNFLTLPNTDKIEKLYGFDASITQEKGYFLGVTTADCVPILVFDPKNEAIGAIHAGWRGTTDRIVEKTILKMQKSFGTEPKDILAAIGPAISIDYYEVGKEVEKEFLKSGFKLNKSTSYHHDLSKKLHVDLKEINRQELIRLGVPKNQIEKTRYCTYNNSRLFFSARRQSIHSGRMLTGIMLR
ncbi:MAG: Laccase domain protein YfiH [Bacteroidetes bacterium ADurb.BinA174]|nr:MAG: Laccase domain protein YfiH [Bacteroidetes bacterium ADurb.BinA174]